MSLRRVSRADIIVRWLRLIVVFAVWAFGAFGQQIPFVPVTGANAPSGASFLLPDTIRGGLWLGGMVEGTEGLTYFDGSRFVRPLEGLFPKALVSGMAEDSKGGIWLATSTGLFRAFHGRLERIGNGGYYYGLIQAAQDLLLTTRSKPVGKRMDVLRVTEDSHGHWRVEPILEIEQQFTLRPHGSNRVLYWCSGGYCEFSLADAAQWQPGNVLAIQRHAASEFETFDGYDSLIRDRFGCLWVTRNSQVEYSCPDGKHATAEERKKISGPGGGVVSELKDGEMLIASYAKLSIGRPGHFRIVTALNGYPGAVGYAVTPDGSMWFSNANGLFLYPTKLPMEFWTEREGLEGNTYSIVRLQSKTFAVAGASLRVLSDNRSRWDLLPIGPDVRTLRAGENNTVLALNEQGQAWQLRGNGEMIGPVRRAGDPDAAWPCPIEKGCVFSAIDGNGNRWYGSNGAEANFSLLENPGSTEQRTTTFESGGEIGVAKLRFLGIDKRGWIWRGSPVGVYVADPEEARQGQWLYLNHLDGISGTDANHNSFFSDPDGSVWFGLDNSVNHLTPPVDFLHPNYAPDVFVSGFSLDGAEMQMAEMVKEIQHSVSVVAHIGSLQYDRRNALRLRYRLLPEQTAWRDSRSLDLALGVLAAGSHTLEVQGRIFAGPWSGTVSRSFTVLRPVWMTDPYLLSYLAAALLIAACAYWVRRRQMLDEKLLLPNLGEWRMNALLPEGHELTGLTLDGRFEVGAVLARGGFATVLAGYDRKEKRKCAVKVFRGEVSNKASMLAGFQQEVAALRQIRHPHVVSIYADGITAAGAPYVAMEFIDGRNLRDILKDGPLTARRTGRLLEQLAQALDAIHARGICHRDVKPENVIVRDGPAGEMAVLIDFSIAIIKDVNETMHGISRAAGTFDYMAPEQALGYAEPSSDVFGLAKMTIELLCGVKVSELLRNRALDLPARVPGLLERMGLAFSGDSVEMLARALEFDPTKRPQGASEFTGPLVRDLSRG